MKTLLAALVFISTASLFAGQDATGVKHALLVGVQDYKGTGLGNLKYCENDVHALADLLPALGYTADNVVLLTRKLSREKDNDSLRPTAANVRKWLASICQDAKASDTVLIAFAGHGLQLKATDKMYFCPLESNLAKIDTLISLDEIYAVMENDCKAGVKLMLVDACRNDPLDGRRVAADDRVKSLSRPQIPDPPGGMAAFFSCSKAQTAYESDTLKHGIFFSCVMDALRGKAANEDGEVTIPLLEDYLARTVPKIVKSDTQNPEIQQIPERRGTLRGTGVLGHVTMLPNPNAGAAARTDANAVDAAPLRDWLDEFAKKFGQLPADGLSGVSALYKLDPVPTPYFLICHTGVQPGKPKANTPKRLFDDMNALVPANADKMSRKDLLKFKELTWSFNKSIDNLYRLRDHGGTGQLRYKNALEIMKGDVGMPNGEAARNFFDTLDKKINQVEGTGK